MNVKLDENLGFRGAALLRAAGHHVSTVTEQGLTSTDDSTLIQRCHAESKCLVTLDLDFSNPLVFDPKNYSGIAVIRLPSNPAPDDLDEAIKTLVDGLVGQEIYGKLWVIQRGRIRVYESVSD
ncbi:MAG: DUF5615 family PIN-like protein [SAR202 cluster bacterium]|nr:DUF5615 family PIN-like protein [SAR202 cluster bacterium]MDP6513745.1 DUF5615 family PIN-like protein [SAR202 cluster bacterium]MDP6714149.1 DUF5615 family PIN-like protein [SAR202 cluster bacterium]